MSAWPGVFFIFLATVMIAIAVIKDKPFSTGIEVTEPVEAGSVEEEEPPEAPPHKLKLKGEG